MAEAFMVNPRGRRIKRHRKSHRRNPLMVIGNPKGRRTHRRKRNDGISAISTPVAKINPFRLKHRRFKIRRRPARKNPLAELSLASALSDISLGLGNPRGHKIHRGRFLIHPKRRTTMARRKRRHNPTHHRLSVTGRRGRIRVSRKARLVRRYRGRLLNPRGMAGALAIPPIMDIVWLAGGGILSRALPTFLPLPVSMKTGFQRVIVQGVSAILMGNVVVGMLLKQKRIGTLITMGGLVATAITVLDSYALKGRLAEGDLSVYLPESGVGAYLPEGTELSQGLLPEQESGIVSGSEADIVNALSEDAEEGEVI